VRSGILFGAYGFIFKGELSVQLPGSLNKSGWWKNSSQIGNLPQIGVKIKIFETTT